MLFQWERSDIQPSTERKEEAETQNWYVLKNTCSDNNEYTEKNVRETGQLYFLDLWYFDMKHTF